MSNRDIANRVLTELKVQTESVRRDPSEENYRRAEKVLEEAGSSDGMSFFAFLVMVAIAAFCVFVGINVISGILGSPAATHVPTGNFGGSIQQVWVDTNVYQDDQKGMFIHVRFDTWNLRGIECGATAYFEYASGAPLKDFNGSYTDVAGNVALGMDFTPGYDNTYFDDLSMFMPYDELHMAAGSYTLKFHVQLYDLATNNHFASSNSVYLDFQPG